MEHLDRHPAELRSMHSSLSFIQIIFKSWLKAKKQLTDKKTTAKIKDNDNFVVNNDLIHMFLYSNKMQTAKPNFKVTDNANNQVLNTSNKFDRLSTVVDDDVNLSDTDPERKLPPIMIK
ncbi:hypothetical protein CEXT_657791 [Caerostris extrusa]|uniref:Uncharacterized protein n=1 Tax=Caerostris extrusa TaxID=172846 RepID=A0AAV4WW73_CAEEX|nr:hypothetical protein CEXT_657791 [Caerostris extrusa]